jgi:PAS domain S-box-containing protein
MELGTATRLSRWVKSAEARTLDAGRLRIGLRLIFGFAFIILSMLAADAIILWQFHEVRIQAGRLNDIDQKLVAVLRVHTSMLVFHDRLDQFADDEDADRLVKETGPLRAAVLEDIRRATSILNLPPFDPRRDPTILPTLHVIQSALLSELEAITTLAESGDWRAVHLRLAHEVRPLESLTSDLVEKVDREVGEQQAQTVRNIMRVQRLVFMIAPLTAVVTLLIAATLGLAITRSITKPLARLVEASKALARGQFQHQVSVSGKDELAELGQVFNDTARRLRDLYATLQSSEDRLRLVIDTIPTFAWTALPDGSEDFVTRHWHEYSGLSAKESVGEGWEVAVHPADLKRHLEKWRTSLASGEPFENEVRYRRSADGQYRWFLSRAVPLRDAQGKIVEWYGISTDIEDRKRAEEERERLRADLAHVNRVSMLGELAASVSHELRQPIAAAMTDAKTCVRWLKRDPPSVEEATAAAMRIVNDGSHATEIIERLRSLYKKDLPERELVEVNEIIRAMFELLRAEANQYAISIRTDLVADLPKITADRVQLQQVFMNLILNAIEAMKETGGVLTVKTQLGDGQLLISVSDTGVGLPKGKTEQIFEAFFTTKPQGSGMGLSISRSIVESHGGRLWAMANNGRGATFHFTLPTAAETLQVPATGT